MDLEPPEWLIWVMPQALASFSVSAGSDSTRWRIPQVVSVCGQLLAQLRLQVSPCIVGISSFSWALGLWQSQCNCRDACLVLFPLLPADTSHVLVLAACLQLLCVPMLCTFQKLRHFCCVCKIAFLLSTIAFNLSQPWKKAFFQFYSCSSLVSTLTVTFWLCLFLRSFIMFQCFLCSGICMLQPDMDDEGHMQRNGSPLKTLQTAGGRGGKGRFLKQLLAIIGSNNLKRYGDECVLLLNEPMLWLPR